MFLTLLITIAAVLYAARQHQRRRWTERVMTGRSAAAAYANLSFLINYVNDREPNEGHSVLAGLLHPNFLGAKAPTLIVGPCHPDFQLCESLTQGQRILLTYNPDGSKWGDETDTPQTAWSRHVRVVKQESELL